MIPMKFGSSIPFVLFAVLLSMQFPSLHAQDCEGLQVLSAFVNPFNDAEVMLLSENSNVDSLYDYPSWHMVNADGEELGAETVNLFGLWGMQWHVIALNAPWPAEVLAAQEMTWALWSGFNEFAACTIEQPFEPRTWEHAGTGAEGCAPLRLELTAPGAVATGFSWSLTDGNGGLVAEDSGSFSQETGWFAYADSLCLSQHVCHELTLTGAGGPVHAQWVHASSWHGVPGFSLTTATPGVPVTGVVDLYGGDCVGMDVAGRLAHEELVVAPNPTHGEVRVQGDQWVGRPVEVLSPQGELLWQGKVGEGGKLGWAQMPDGLLILRLEGQTTRILKLP